MEGNGWSGGVDGSNVLGGGRACRVLSGGGRV